MKNILYCFDNNYNYQALNSITSLLKHTDEKLNIFIIHEHPKKFLKILKKYLNTQANINIFKFNDNHYDFPRVNNTHVSIATYYRLFISNYIEDSLDTILYLDADTICSGDLTEDIKNLSEKILKEDILFAASSEVDPEISCKRLGMKQNKYFNAGVMLINFKKWKKENTGEKLLNIMKRKYDNILWWDQDILNVHADGDYLELNQELNFRSNYHNFKNEEKLKVYHFLGDLKPWNPETVGSEYSEIYQNEYRNATSKKYHIEFKENSLKNSYYRIFKSGKIKEINYSINFIYVFLGKLIKYFFKKLYLKLQ